jgi:hypothetical protein
MSLLRKTDKQHPRGWRRITTQQRTIVALFLPLLYYQFSATGRWPHQFLGSFIPAEQNMEDKIMVTPMEAIMKIAGSLERTAEEGQIYCNTSFPASKIELFYVEDRILSLSTNHTHPKTNIPKIIHMTSSTRCMSKPLFDNIMAWKEALPDYSFVLHDNQAVKRFFQQVEEDYENHLGFPVMTMFLPCLTGAGAGISDIWRYMFIFQYEGLYVDTDDSPGDFVRVTLDSYPEAEAILVQYSRYYIAQNFFMVKARHPLLRFTVMQVLFNLLHLTDVDYQPVALTTGPPAMGKGYHKFMGYYDFEPSDNSSVKFWWPGHYVGHGNWSVDIVADWRNVSRVERFSAIPLQAKKEYYAAVDSVDYDRVYKPRYVRFDPCFARLANALESNRKNSL